MEKLSVVVLPSAYEAVRIIVYIAPCMGMPVVSMMLSVRPPDKVCPGSSGEAIAAAAHVPVPNPPTSIPDVSVHIDAAKGALRERAKERTGWFPEFLTATAQVATDMLSWWSRLSWSVTMVTDEFGVVVWVEVEEVPTDVGVEGC